MKLSEIADLVSGQVIGEDITITGASGLPEAKEGDIAFLDQFRYLPALAESKASAVIVSPEFADSALDRPAILCEAPRIAFAKVLATFAPIWELDEGIHSTAVVDPSAELGEEARIGALSYIGKRVKIGKGARIYPHVVIGDDVEIGDNVELFPLVCIYHACKLGNNIRIHSGSVIGSDGFGYAQGPAGLVKIPQVGIVVIEDEVEIGSNTSIDRATTGVTLISNGAKLDNQVQVAHNVRIGRNSIICGQAGIAGSSQVGDGVILAGQVGIGDHLTVGDGSQIGAKAAVLSDVPAGASYHGYPARPHREQLRIWGNEPKLAQLVRTVRELEKRLAELEAREDIPRFTEREKA